MSAIDASLFEGVVLGRKLGSGSFGTVHVGLLPNGQYVGVKILGITPQSEAQADEINKEVEVQKALNHPNIVRYLGSVKMEGKLYIFLEFVTGGSLTSIMKTLPDSHFPISVARVYTRHMLQGLKYLHSRNVAHRDIKGDNLLISMDTGVAKLADFDQAKVIGTVAKTNTLAGTPYWMAPEVITEEAGYNPIRADIWSAGCTVAEMVTGKPPWVAQQTPMAVVCKIAASKGWPDNIKSDGMPPALVDFLDKCFIRDPLKRPSAEELLEHPFLKE